MSTQAAGHQERLDRVRRALMAAETAVGVRRVDWAGAGTGEDIPARGDGVELPTALAPLVPGGVIRRGTTTCVTGSTTLACHLIAALASQESWTAIVGYPDLGLAALFDAGLDPARVVLVPEPGPNAVEVLGAVVDGFDVVLVGEGAALQDRDRRALSQRVRHRGALLVSSAPWPGAEVTFVTENITWNGLSVVGRVTGGNFLISSTGRGIGARHRVVVAMSEAVAGTALRSPEVQVPALHMERKAS